jgi:hypothetical protein
VGALPEGDELLTGQVERLRIHIQAEQLACWLAFGEQTGGMAACAERPIHVASSTFRA